MDAPLVEGDESSSSMYDVLENDSLPSPELGLLNDSLRKEINRSLETLTQREAEVLKYYFGLDGKPAISLDEIGQRFDLTRERVRQIKEKAIRRLKHTGRSKMLRSYLG
jgi:RNA polymerase primary sigma factor